MVRLDYQLQKKYEKEEVREIRDPREERKRDVVKSDKLKMREEKFSKRRSEEEIREELRTISEEMTKVKSKKTIEVRSRSPSSSVERKEKKEKKDSEKKKKKEVLPHSLHVLFKLKMLPISHYSFTAALFPSNSCAL